MNVGGELQAGGDAKALEDRLQVVLHRLLADLELPGDLRIAAAGGYEQRHAALPRRQRPRVFRASRDHGESIIDDGSIPGVTQMGYAGAGREGASGGAGTA